MKKKKSDTKSSVERWGEFRFSVIGHLLSAPPCAGELKAALKTLSLKNWRHPISGEPTILGLSTIERWYYRALKERKSPVKSLSRKIRLDYGSSRRMTPEIIKSLESQYSEHPSWSRKLHSDNLRVAFVDTLKPVPSYQTITRYMNHRGLVPRPCSKSRNRAGHREALSHLENQSTAR